MKMKRAVAIVFLTVFVTAPATGCLSIVADELYSLPEVSEEYLKLQAQINVLQSRGAIYAAPARGPNRQAVQLKDINGNGENEVIAFFSFPGESKLVIYIFTMDNDDYVVAEIIESAGTEIESVRYVDMDADGNMEIVIGWQMGSTLKYMSIYSIVDFHSQMIVSGEEYTEVSVFNATGTGGEDVVVLKIPMQEAGNATAKIFSLMQDGEVVTEEARLSAGVDSFTRILAGRLDDNVPAMFVDSEGRFDNGTLVTDVLARQRGSFTNISLQTASAVSTETVRNRMNSLDLNNDGSVLVPALRRLVAQSDTEYFAIDWYAYRSTGTRALALTTYHNTFDEWYLVLPRDWREKVSVRREDSVPGERTIIFSHFEDPEAEKYSDFLKIYRLSGDNAEAMAQREGRVLLQTEGSVSYAFEILAAPNSFGLTFDEETIRENFRLIHTEWQMR